MLWLGSLPDMYAMTVMAANNFWVGAYVGPESFRNLWKRKLRKEAKSKYTSGESNRGI